MKKTITIIVGLLCVFFSIWFFMRSFIFHLMELPYYRAVSKSYGPILLIVGVIIFFIGYGMEKEN